MLKFQKEIGAGGITVRLMGDIDETFSFESILSAKEIDQSPPAEFAVIGKEIRRINSTGVKNWIKYFQLLQSKATQIRLVECSVALVEQINQISNFTCGAQVESVYVPFCCRQCKTDLVGLFTVESLIKRGLQLPLLKCSKCGGESEFDDIEDEYFGFLKR